MTKCSDVRTYRITCSGHQRSIILHFNFCFQTSPLPPDTSFVASHIYTDEFKNTKLEVKREREREHKGAYDSNSSGKLSFITRACCVVGPRVLNQRSPRGIHYRALRRRVSMFLKRPRTPDPERGSSSGCAPSLSSSTGSVGRDSRRRSVTVGFMSEGDERTFRLPAAGSSPTMSVSPAWARRSSNRVCASFC